MKTQRSDLEQKKKEYETEQFVLIKTTTKLLPDVAKLCLAYLKSFPMLRLQTVGTPDIWSNITFAYLLECIAQDMSIQCMFCQQFKNVPYSENDYNKEASTSNNKEVGKFGFNCGSCSTLLRDVQYELNWCKDCNRYCLCDRRESGCLKLADDVPQNFPYIPCLANENRAHILVAIHIVLQRSF